VYDEKELKWFDRMGVKRPDHFEHGLTDTTENPLSTQLPKLRCSNWRRQGNYLMADTPMGTWSQYLDPAYIVLGEDNGLPVLHKVI
jgi:hypothetical protein